MICSYTGGRRGGNDRPHHLGGDPPSHADQTNAGVLETETVIRLHNAGRCSRLIRAETIRGMHQRGSHGGATSRAGNADREGRKSHRGLTLSITLGASVGSGWPGGSPLLSGMGVCLSLACSVPGRKQAYSHCPALGTSFASMFAVVVTTAGSLE